MKIRLRSLLPGGVLLATLLAPAAAPSSKASPSPAPTPRRRPSLVLITADGLRADRLGCYHGSKPTPSIDGLAADARLFEQVLSPSPSCLPSLATILTGLYPVRHGVWEDDYRNQLESRVPSLAERLRQAGYRTAAFVGTSRLAASRGFNRGFASYEDGYYPDSAGVWKLVRRPGKTLVPAVRAWLDKRGSSPFFLWVHFAEPGVLGPAKVEDPMRDAPAAYSRRVDDLDASVGELLGELKRRGMYDGSVIVLTSDHGLGLGDHGELLSGIFLYDTTLHVPLLVKEPASGAGKGSRVGDLAGLVDLYPTLERLLGLSATPGLPGRDLFSAPSPRAYYAVALLGREAFGWSPLELVAEGSLRLVTGAGARLYDLVADPGQERDVSAARAADAVRLEALRPKLTGASVLPAAHFLPTSSIPDLLARRVEGFVLVSPNDTQSGAPPLDDPAKHVRSLALLEATHLEVEMAGFAAFEKAENSLLEAEPSSPFTLMNAAQLNLLRGARDPQALLRAAAQIQTTQQIYPRDPEVYHLLGHLALASGNPNDAVDFLTVSKLLGPRYPSEVAYDLACAYARGGKSREAVAELRRGIHLGYRDGRHISADPDLESLREDPAYKSLMREEFPSLSGS